MNAVDAERLQVRKILDENPAFARVLRQFQALYDAAEVLDELKPPQHEVAAPYLRAIEYGNVFWPHGDNFIWLHSSQR